MMAGRARRVVKMLVVGGLLAAGIETRAARAQTPAVAAYAVEGIVTDWKDVPIADAVLKLTGSGKTYEITSDKDGRYRFTSVPRGKYQYRIEARGFPPLTGEFDLDKAPDGPINVKMQVLLTERVNVSADASQTVSNFSSLTLTSEDLEGVPAGLLIQRLRELAGVTGRPETVPIYVDGFRAGLRLPPKEAIEMVRISSNSFAPEFPDVGYGRIEITTKPGVDTYHGQFQFDMNDDGLNARDPFAATRGASRSTNYSAYLGGPLMPLRWDFLAYSGRWQQDVSQVINALTVDPLTLSIAPFTANFPTPERSSNIFVQSGFLLSPRHSLSGSYSRTAERAQSQGLQSGRDLPEYGFNRTASDRTVRASLISTFGTRTLNELRVERSGRRQDMQAATAGPAIVVFDAFNGGGNQSGFSSRDSRVVLQVSDHLTRAYQKHTVKAGAEIKVDRLDNLDRSGWGGMFVFGTDVDRDAGGSPIVDAGGQMDAIAPVENYRRTLLGLAGYGPSQFSVVRGDPSVAISQVEVAFFAQDDWRPSPQFTLSYGVRSEGQTNLKGWLNVAPRFALAWTADKKGLGTIRWGGGVFHNRVDPQLTFEALKLDGRHQQQIIIPRPQFFPQVPENLEAAASPSTIRRKADALATPYAVVSSLTYERQLPANLFGSIEYRTQKGGRVLRSRRLAPQTPAAAPVLQFESAGRSSRHEFVFGARAQVKAQTVFVSYTLSYSRNDTDGPSTLPSDSSDLSNEFGWASDDQRHRLAFSGSIPLPLGVALSSSVSIASARPFNITTGRDNNGDTIFMDRPAFANPSDPDAVLTDFGWLTANPATGARIIPRNFGRGASEINTSLYVFRPFKLNRRVPGPTVLGQSDAAPGERAYTMFLGVSAENLINRANLTGFNSVLTSSAFGSAIRAMGPRKIQVSLSVSF